MITRLDPDERVREWGLREEVVEKDYVLGWLLWGIGSDEPVLGNRWMFKGGTCLKKCYIETYRFSEDLDFTIMPGAAVMPDALGAVFTKILGRVHGESGIDFGRRVPRSGFGRPAATWRERCTTAVRGPHRPMPQ